MGFAITYCDVEFILPRAIPGDDGCEGRCRPWILSDAGRGIHDIRCPTRSNEGVTL